jgi:hypothetical protein
MKSIALSVSVLLGAVTACGADSQCHETDDIALLQHSKVHVASKSSGVVKAANKIHGTSLEASGKAVVAGDTAGAVGDISGAAGDSACACLEWKKVYSDFGVKCGAANELGAPAAGGLPDPDLVEKRRTTFGLEMCTRFFETLGTNFCVNAQQGLFTDWRSGQWCYVSSKCKSLGPGAKIPGKAVAWKTCDHSDQLLRHMAPLEIKKLADEQDLDSALTVKMAYTTIPNGVLMDNSTQIEMQKAGSPYPLVFDSFDHHPPFQVVKGGKVYLVYPKDWTSMHPRNFNHIDCVKGC